MRECRQCRLVLQRRPATAQWCAGNQEAKLRDSLLVARKTKGCIAHFSPQTRHNHADKCPNSLHDFQKSCKEFLNCLQEFRRGAGRRRLGRLCSLWAPAGQVAGATAGALI